MNRIISCISAIFCIIVITVPVAAESLFLKDGSIIEGKITAESNETVQIRLSSGASQTINRSDLIRTLPRTDFKTPVFFYLLDKRVINAHLIEEKDDNYIIRAKLDDPEETAIKRTDVNFVSKSEVSVRMMDDKESRKVIPLADAVLLNDGSIIEGKIIKESESGVLIETSGSRREIAQDQIMRVLFKSEFRRKVYIYRKNWSMTEGFIVGENAEEIFVRASLNAAKETAVKKADINFIARSMVLIIPERKKKTK